MQGSEVNTLLSLDLLGQTRGRRRRRCLWLNEKVKRNFFGSDRSPRSGNVGSVSVGPSVYLMHCSLAKAFKQRLQLLKSFLMSSKGILKGDDRGVLRELKREVKRRTYKRVQ